MNWLMKRLMMLLHAEGDAGGGGGDQGDKGGETPEQKTAREAAEKAERDKGKTPEQIAAEAARAEVEKDWKPEQKAAADAAAERAKKAGKDDAYIAIAREEAALAALESKTGGGAPEKYDLKLPESSTFAPEDVKAFEAWAKSIGLTNEQAQAAIDGQVEMIDMRLAEFKEQTEADPEFGGDKLAETQRLANLALDKLRPKGHPRRDALMQFLEHTGAINNIHVVSILADAGRMMDEDSSGGGSGGGRGAKARTEDRMFPKTAKTS